MLYLGPLSRRQYIVLTDRYQGSFERYSVFHIIILHSLYRKQIIFFDFEQKKTGVSISYPSGEQCNPSAEKGDPTAGIKRSVTIDVQCANTKSRTVSAQEPDKCAYRIAMKSFYGCPTVGPFHHHSYLVTVI